ncbi:PBP1A family penicillin-binding protein [Desulfovibrio sp. OttesenSCG-928-F07]|nr:PBP1A family penicillin-binding protein [Desulfovibrio sp. OttesenSCG-928-F07]
MKRFFLISLIVLLCLGVLGAISMAGLVFWASRDLPSYTQVSDYRPAQVTTVYAADESVLGYFYDEKRFLVNLAEMPPLLPKAFLAAEDASFYEHDGINPKAILRAFIKNMRAGSTVEGGSTITQQLVKRLLLTSERSYMRKLKEAILAYRLERYLSKDDILNMYLNQIFFGHSSYGVEAAARTYFGKHVGELTLAECAVLAALPQAPSRTNPYADPQATRDRQRYVLRRMLVENFITQEEHDEALNAPLVYRTMPDPSWKLGAWYLEEVRRTLIDFLQEQNVVDLGLPLERFGRDALYNAGLHIYTSMDPVHQKSAELALRKGLLATSKRHGWLGPLEQLQPEERDAFIEKNVFVPQDLDNAGWVKALVVKSGPKEAEVRMGSFKGVIAAEHLAWAREPNPAVDALEPGHARTPNQVLKPGDVVWVSAVGAQGDANPVGFPASATIAAYNSAEVTFDKPIPLSLEQYPAVSGAIVSQDVSNGNVLALVGGYEYSVHDQYNRVTQASRQPGSAFKPLVYSAALDNGYNPASMIEDAPYVSDRGTEENTSQWRPSNFDGVFYGPIMLRTALAKSRNLCTIRLSYSLGVQPIIERAKAFGVPGDIPQDLSISLGSHALTPLALNEAYTAFAGNGQRVRPRMIQRINNSWGHTIVTFSPEHIDAISPQNAYVMASMLKEVIAGGTAHRAKHLTHTFAGKTGTTNDERDAWFVGFSPFLATTVYAGYDTPKAMGKNETGSRVAVPIFASYMESIELLYPEADFTMPPGVRMLSIDADNGQIAGLLSENVVEMPFITGTEPTKVSGAPRKRGEDDVRGAEELFQQ